MKTPFLSSFNLSGFRSAIRFSPKNLVPEIFNLSTLVVHNCTAITVYTALCALLLYYFDQLSMFFTHLTHYKYCSFEKLFTTPKIGHNRKLRVHFGRRVLVRALLASVVQASKAQQFRYL